MRQISESHERTWYLVEEWKTATGLLARVQKCVWKDRIKAIASILTHDFYTGYVQVPDGYVADESKLEVHGGVTYNGGMEDTEGNWGLWVGFDMSHAGDEDKQDLAYAKAECEKLATQISPSLLTK